MSLGQAGAGCSSRGLAAVSLLGEDSSLRDWLGKYVIPRDQDWLELVSDNSPRPARLWVRHTVFVCQEVFVLHKSELKLFCISFRKIISTGSYVYV